MLYQGILAAQDPAGQNVLAGETGTAFAMAVDEAVAQGGLKGMAGDLPAGEPEEKDKGKLSLNLCLSGISALLAQGAYHIQQAADAAAAGNQALSVKSGPEAEDEGQGRIASGSAAGMKDMAVREGFLPMTDVPGELTAMKTAKDTALKETAVEEAFMAEAADAAPGPVFKAAKEKSELDQAGIRNIQKPQAQGAVKAAQFMGNDSARETVNTSPDDVEKSVPAIRGMASAVKPEREKEKPGQITGPGLAAAYKPVQTMHKESAQPIEDAAPENAVREENAAMQVARASVHALRRGMTEYRVRLSPEGLGDVEVTVVTKGKAVSLSMRTDNQMAKELILDHADELRAELNGQNYQVSGLSVEVGMNGGNGSGLNTSREHAGPVFETGRQVADQEAPDTAEDRGQQSDPRIVLPRSSTISYRI